MKLQVDGTRSMLAVALLAALAQAAMVLSPSSLVVVPAHTSMLTVHLLLELFAVVVALSIVMVAWHTFEIGHGRSAHILIAGFLAIATCDLVHALTYEGMPDFLAPSSTERAIFFWLAGRTVEVVTAALIATRPNTVLPRGLSLLLGAIVSLVLVWWGTYGLDYFPTTFVKGSGVTPFKAEFEVALFVANTLVALWFARIAATSGQSRFAILAASCWVIGVGELSFTSYVQPSDFQNIFGHVYKVVGYGLMYWAVFIVRIRAPFDALRASEARAVEGERRLRSISDHLPNCFVHQIIQEPDGQFHYTFVGEAIVWLLGLNIDEVLSDGSAFSKRIHADDRDSFLLAGERAIDNFSVLDWSGRVWHADGRLRWMQVVTAPRRLPDGRTAWDGIVTDITERHLSAESHREKEAMLAAVIHSASDAVISTDMDGRITLFNPAAERIFGRTAGSLLGQSLKVLLPAKARPSHDADMQRFAQSGVSSRRMSAGRVQGVRSDRTELELEASISQVTVNDKQILTAILRDVTDRVRSERDLKQYRDELAGLTHQLMAQEKETTSRLAQALHDQLGQTLTAIRINYVSEATLADPRMAARHARVDMMIDQAIREVRQVLVDLRPTVLDDLGLFPALDNEIRTRQISESSVHLQLEATAGLGTQRWPGNVEYAAFMVAREAIANALSHARPSLVRVVLTGGPAWLKLEVIDNGTGIAPAGAAGRPGHLGMVGMRERSIAIGGRFAVQTAPGTGTTVSLTWEEPAP